MTDQTAETATDARRQAASDAYLAARSAVLRLAEAEGAQIRERPIWPGAASATRYAEPLAGIRAAQTLERTAARTVRDYVRYARSDGIGWQEIGEALGLAEDGGPSGYELAVAAHEYAAGKPDAWRQSSFGYDCQACGKGVSDLGPYESHPEDNERGHAEGCTRLAAEVASWQARQDEWEAGN